MNVYIKKLKVILYKCVEKKIDQRDKLREGD